MFVTYTGETNERGEAHGQGVKEWVAVSRYEGEWKDGKRHGRGEIKYADGSRYEGQWKDGKKHAGYFFSSKHDLSDWNNFAFRMAAKFKEGHLDGEIFLPVLMVGVIPNRFPDRVDSTWEDGRLVSDHHSAQESLALERAGEEIEQMREFDSSLDEGLN